MSLLRGRPGGEFAGTRPKSACPSGRVDLADGDAIDVQLARGLVDHRLEHHRSLQAARSALRGGRRRIGRHRDAAEAHVRHLIHQRRVVGRRRVIALAAIRARGFDDEHVTGGDAAILLEAHLDPARVARAGAADVGLFLARDAHHHRTAVELLREQRRNRHRVRAGNLAAEAAAGVLADEDELLGLDADPARDGGDCAGDALRRAVEIELAVLPVRHRRARLERLVGGGLLLVVAFDDQIGFREALLHVAEDQRLGGGGVGRELAGVHLRHVVGRPLQRLEGVADEDVAFRAPVGAAWTQGLEGIDHERKRLVLHHDAFDGGGGDLFGVGGDGENGLALVDRLLGQRHFGRDGRPRRRGRCGARSCGGSSSSTSRRRSGTSRGCSGGGCGTRGRRALRLSLAGVSGRTSRGGACARRGGALLTTASATLRGRRGRSGGRRGRGRRGRHVVGRQNGVHPRHGQGGTGVDARHPGVRPRAQQQLGEQHALGTPVLGVPRLAGHFRDQVGRHVVLANELVFRHLTPSASSRLRSSCSRGSCCSRHSGRDCRISRAPAARGSAKDWS